MRQLVKQFLKFGIVGIIAFGIDFLVTMVVYVALDRLTGFRYSEMIGSFLGFSLSVLVNYILSMRFVFERREDMNRQREMMIFLVLSVIGLFINLAVVWLVTHPLYENLTGIHAYVPKELAVAVAKVGATAVVMVWNFVTRKIFLEKKS